MFKLVNSKAYKPGPVNKMIELKVIVMLDAVPGAWHEPEDVMRFINTHNYVQSVELVKTQSFASFEQENQE